MNNYILLEEEVPVNNQESLRIREAELVRVIESLGSLSVTQEWSTLKKYVFDGVLENLEKRMVSESHKMPLNEKEIYKLQGQILWAKKYANLTHLLDQYRSELINVRNLLNPPTEREHGS